MVFTEGVANAEPAGIVLGQGASQDAARQGIIGLFGGQVAAPAATVDVSDQRWGILSKLAKHEYYAVASQPDGAWGMGAVAGEIKFPVNADGSIRTNLFGWFIFDTFVGDQRRYANRKLVHEAIVGDNGLYARWTRGDLTVEYAVVQDREGQFRLVVKNSKRPEQSYVTLMVDKTLPDAKKLSQAGFVRDLAAMQEVVGASLDTMKDFALNGGGGGSTAVAGQSPMFAAGARQMQSALKAKDVAAAAALVPKLEVVATSDSDRYQLGRYMADLSVQTGDNGMALRGHGLMADSGKIPLKDMPQFYARRGALLVSAARYRDADTDLRIAMEMGVRTEAVYRAAATAKTKLGEAAAAQQFTASARELEVARIAEEQRLQKLKQEEMARRLAAQRKREEDARLAAAAPKRSGGGVFGKIMAATGGALAAAAGGGDGSAILGKALDASTMVSNSGDWVGPSAGNPLASTGNQNPLVTGGSSAGTGVIRSGGSGYPARANLLEGEPACAMMNESNYRTVALSGGDDVQLKTMCGQAFEYYVMYKRAISQGYSEADANKTYYAHETAAKNAISFYRNYR